MKVETIAKTEWLSLRKMVDPDKGVGGYIYSHEDRCDGIIISILPYRVVDEKYEFLLRNEVTPAWSMNQSISSITGGLEHGNLRETVVQEMAEEAGYEITKEDLIFLDKTRGTKSSDTIYYIYTVDLTGKEKTLDASGDGSELEKQAECFWSDTIENAVDPFVYVAYYHINSKIK